ncbi:uncharacterized protein LOC131676012 [Topomyia yanbarensis]|uniref:uncharacterized protein LOC131676012 n=1 Tax=Topomyia yanbarensis TaxID=2498891 RepID=UPI00273B3AD6|nr:uncharacterized protein LOC131676012 [Topomyia yanbarensis]
MVKEDAQNNGEDFFKENFRMFPHTFDLLCDKVKHMQKLDSNFRKCIPLRKRVAIAMYALGSSAEYRTIANMFGVGKSTVCQILLDFCNEVWRVMKKDFLNTYPISEEQLKERIAGFEKLGFPQCYGAIDGCHIEVRPNADDAVDYHNYKGWYSTVLLALVDYR